MYRPRTTLPRTTLNHGSGSSRQRYGSVQFQTSAQTSKFDPSLLLERNAYEGLFPTPIGVISKPEEETGDKPGDELKISNYKCIGSYSWIDAAKDTPTILVPGSPPQWTWKNGSLPVKVPQPDKPGPRIIDQNGFRTSAGGIGYLVPVIAAVTYNQRPIDEPPFDWSSVDIVADRAALRKLLRWANDKQHPAKSDQLFRLDLQLVGEKTILINRVALKFAEDHLYKTYREGFIKKVTTPASGCRNALDYHRIISYDTGGLKMVIRFEADAYNPKEASCNDSQVEELALSLQAASLQSPGTLQIQGLTIQKAGKQVPQTSVLELVTRSTQNRFQLDWSEIYCQLFLSQTKRHAVGYHYNGLFETIEERMLDSDPELETAKTDAQDQMKKLDKVMKRIRKLVMKEGNDSRLSLVCDHGILRVYKRTSQESCLPDEVLKLFE